MKLYGKGGQLIYSQAGPSVADNTATTSAALTNWYIPPGDYVIAIDETTVGAGITGALASVSINGPVKFPNTSTPSITIQGGVESVTDFDNADASTANYFVDWDFTELCSSQEPNTTFNFAVSPSSCCTVPVLPSYTITSDLPSTECGLRTYTVTFSNTTGAAVTNLKFATALDAGQFLVDASVSNLFGGTTNPDPYAGEPNLVIEGMTLPIGTSILTFQVDVTTLIAVDPNNIFTLENDCPATKRTVVFPEPSCDVCENGTAKLKTANAWYTAGALGRTSNSVSNVAIGTPASGAMLADIAVTYPATVEYAASSYPRSYGSYVQLTRNDNLNGAPGAVTYKVSLKDALGNPIAAKPSFNIAGINKISGQATKVKVTGKCGAETINGKLSYAYTRYPQYNSYTIAGNEATGTKYGYSTSTYGTVKVVFDKPVTEVTVEWTVDRTPVRKRYASLYISEMGFECNTVVPEVLTDNVYMEASFQETEVLTCNEGTIKLKVTNLNCNPATINVTNTLPAGLEYVADSYAALDAEDPTYSGQSFNLLNLDVPSGVSYVYVKVKPTNPASSGTYSTFFNFTVVGGVNIPNPYRSDDNSGTAGYQDASIVYTAVAKPIMPTIVKTVDKCFNPLTGSVLTYTLTVSSTSPTDLTNVEISDILEENQKMVAGSLVITGLTGGTPNDYAADQSFITIEGLTIPANVTGATIVFKVNTQDTTDPFTNSATLVIDPTSECGTSNNMVSNEITTTICTFCTNDPNTDAATSFTGVGITSQATKRAGWPEDVPNGFIVLESKDKGFVITRLTTGQRDALTTVEGMLIYNTTTDAMELYNGTAWITLTRSCND